MLLSTELRDAPATTALLAGRSRFNASYRLLMRFQQVADRGGGARTRRWRALAAVSAAGDIALVATMRRSGRSMYPPRLLLDALDQAAWSCAPYPESWDFAVLPGVPLAFEVGGERGAVGLGVPVLNYAAVVRARRLVGRPTSPLPFLWQIAAVATGMAFTRLDRALRREAIANEHRRREAECDRALLAGQHSVAVGTANALDRLRRVGLMLGDDRADSPVRLLCDTWRTSLGEQTRERAAYLREVFLRHERRRATVPDLAAHVRFRLSEDTGTTLLSPHQSDQLALILDGLGLRGIVTVDVVDRPARWLPGTELSLDVGDRRIVLPADPERRRRPPEAGPIALALNVMWFGRTTASVAEAVPYKVAGPTIGLSLLSSVWAHRLLGRRGPAGRGPVLAVAVGISLIHTVFGSTMMRRPVTDYGRQNSMLYATATAPGVIGSYHFDTLSRLYRALLFGGLAAIGAAALACTRRPIRWGQFVAASAWSLGTLVPGLEIESSFQQAVEPEMRDLRAETRAAASSAYEHGRQTVLAMVADAATDARERFQAQRSGLPDGLAADVRETLAEVEASVT